MIANSQLSTTEPKKEKQRLSNYNRNRITEIEITWKVISGEGERGNGGKGSENKKYKW